MRKLFLLVLAGSLMAGHAEAGVVGKTVKKAVVVTAVIGGAGLYAAAMQKRAAKRESQQDVLADSPDGYERPTLEERASDAGEKAKHKIEDWILKSDTRKLRANLAKAGEHGGKNCDAHHIVPKNDNREWAKIEADELRQVLDECGIGIDSADNGVFLPGSQEETDCPGSYHRTLHTKEYYSTLIRLLIFNTNGDCSKVSKGLGRVKELLRADNLR